MEEIRCNKCNKLLFKIEKEKIETQKPLKVKISFFDTLKIEMMCPRCKHINK